MSHQVLLGHMLIIALMLPIQLRHELLQLCTFSAGMVFDVHLGSFAFGCHRKRWSSLSR